MYFLSCVAIITILEHLITPQKKHYSLQKKKKNSRMDQRDFPGGPVGETVLPVPRARVPSLARELDPTDHN